MNEGNLVEGKNAYIESTDGSFEPFEVHYAETFIVPAAVGAYEVRPAAGCEGPIMFVRASVRGTEGGHHDKEG